MIPVPPKADIEEQARAAATAGRSLNEACPYPFESEAGRHFVAVYLLAVPVARPEGGDRWWPTP